jgi:hypothetical protein
MITIRPTAKRAGAGPTDSKRKRADSKAVRTAQANAANSQTVRGSDEPSDCETATVRDGEKEFKGRHEVVERLWKIHCFTDCVKTVGPHALKVLFLLVCVIAWGAGLADVGGLLRLLTAVKPW